MHVPEVECNSKVKTYKHHEFGVKVGIVVTNRSNGLEFSGNLYDGASLATLLNQVERVTGKKPKKYLWTAVTAGTVCPIRRFSYPVV